MRKSPLLPLALFLCPFAAQAGTFTVEKEADGVVIKLDGQLLTKYVTKSDSNKPYFFPVIGPDGKSMTRAYPMKDVPGEKQDHPHHRSMYFGSQFTNGFDTWHEQKTIDEVKKPEDRERRQKTLGSTVATETNAVVEGDKAILTTKTDYLNTSGQRLVADERKFTFWVDKAGSRIVDVELKFTGTEEDFTFTDAKDAGFSIRVAHSMCLEAKQGGRIMTSEGAADEKAWGTRAKWCDFNGPVDGAKMGIAILNHPSSDRYPTPWHARGYGLFTANPFGLKTVAGEEKTGDVVLKKGDSFVLRYRVIFHKGDEKDAQIEQAFAEYAKVTF